MLALTFSLVSFWRKVKNSKREEVKFGVALVLKMLLPRLPSQPFI